MLESMSKMSNDEKSWFVQKGSQHIGPFSNEEIYDLYHKGKIDENSLLWQDGESDWISLKNINTIYDALSGDEMRHLEEPPAIPSHLLNKNKDRTKLDEVVKYPSLEEIDDVPPIPLPPDSLVDQDEELKTQLELSDNLSNEDVPYDFFESQSLEMKSEEFSSADLEIDEVTEEERTNNEIGEEKESPINKGDFLNTNDAIAVEQHIDSRFTNSTKDNLKESYDTELDPPIETQDVITEDVISSEKQLVDEKILTKEEVNTELYLNNDKNKDISEELEKLAQKRGFPFYLKMVFSTICLMIILLSGLIFYTYSHPNPVKLKGLSEEKFRSLKRVTFKDNIDGPFLDFTMSDNGKVIFAAANTLDQANLEVNFKSVAGKVLSDELIQFSSSGKLANGFVRFNKIEFQKGHTIEPGLYEVFVRANDFSQKGKIKKQLQDLGLFNFFKHIKFYKSSWDFQGRYILAVEKESIVAKKILERNKKFKRDFFLPINERIEKYKTFLELLEKLKVIYFSELDKINKKTNFMSFKRSYGKNIAPILQTVVLDDKKVEVMNNKTREVVKPTEKDLELFGKTISALALKMTEATANKKIDNKFKDQLRLQFTSEIEKLNELGNNSIRSLKNLLK